ncbi:cyclic nucleotide-binding domain-containing protein 2-like isoform X2 [Ptychodera flava]|uniref:cyclic nucleotide-binding domain-containing protein 2-like isoform X2 n=1 Tax=Ptychodera flava TaxID=63121 RepID=UPI003969F722
MDVRETTVKMWKGLGQRETMAGKERMRAPRWLTVKKLVNRRDSKLRKLKQALGSVADDQTQSTITEAKMTSPVYVTTKSNLKPLERFRKAVRQVRMLCAVTISIRRYASEAGVSMFSNLPELAQSMTQIPNIRVQLESETGEPTGEHISFDPRHFKSNYEFTLPKKAEKILEKKTEERTPEDIKIIVNVMRGLYSFRKYTRSLQYMLCKVVRLERYGRRRVVVRKGHYGRGFYFVFSGTACVTLDEDEESVFVKKEISYLKKGACFGEIALLKDVPRQATVVCMEETEFLVIDKDDFFAYDLHLHVEKEFQYRFDFLSKLDLFKSWNKEELEQISDMGRLEEYNHDAVVVKDSKEHDWLLIVTKGKCDVLKLVDLSKIPSFQQALETEYGKVEDVSGPSVMPFANDYNVSDIIRIPTIGMYDVANERKRAAVRPKTTGRILARKDDGDEITRSKSVVPEISENGSCTKSVKIKLESESRSHPYIVVSDHSQPGHLKPPYLHTKGPLSQLVAKDANNAGVGVFVRVDSLRPGQCFGLQGIQGTMPTLSLVSAGCELIRISMSKFRKYANEATLQEVAKQMPMYPSDAELSSKFLKQSQWKNFKSSIVEGVILDALSKKPQFDRAVTIQRHRVKNTKTVENPVYVSYPMPKIPFNADAWANNAIPQSRGTPTVPCTPHKRSYTERLTSASSRASQRSRPASCVSQRSSQISTPPHLAYGGQRRLVLIEQITKPTYTGTYSWRSYYKR